jgi:tRNA(Ile)-lysidine synthase
LFELLRDFGVSQLSSEMLVKTLETSTGKQFHTRTHTITRDREFLVVTKKKNDDHSEIMITPETIMIDHPVKLTFSSISNNMDLVIPSESNVALLDTDKLQFPLKLRNWKIGDRFHPLGMSGSKKVSDFLINQKVALPDKHSVMVIESNGEIAWIVNHRIDNRFKVTTETRKVLQIEYHGT